MGLYLYYQYLLGGLPKKGGSPRRDSFALKAELAKMDRISAETKLLFNYKIETAGQLAEFRSGKQADIDRLTDKRDELRKQQRRAPDTDAKEAYRSEAAGITKELRGLRREISLADDIAARSGLIRENIKSTKELSIEPNLEKQEKEARKDERSRRDR
jgi:hypothetical protein